MAARRKESSVTRELGMALTVLALWMLSLLVPLHQTSGMLRELARAGYDISNAWTVCVTIAADKERPDQPPSMCPAQVVAKGGLVDFDADRLPPPQSVRLHLADWRFGDAVDHVARPEHVVQPRGPPALI